MMASRVTVTVLGPSTVTPTGVKYKKLEFLK